MVVYIEDFGTERKDTTEERQLFVRCGRLATILIFQFYYPPANEQGGIADSHVITHTKIGDFVGSKFALVENLWEPCVTAFVCRTASSSRTAMFGPFRPTLPALGGLLWY